MMLHLTIIVVNVLSLFFQIYNIECVENKHSLFLSLDSLCGLKMCHLTEVKHTTIHYFTFHTINITKYILNLS